MKNWINTHKPLAIGIVAAILAIVIAIVLVVSGKGKDEEKNTENIGTEISTETGENTENNTTEETDVTENGEGNSDEGDTTENTENTESAGTVTSDNGNTQTNPQAETQTQVTPSAPTYTYTEMNKTMYVTSPVNMRSLPSAEGNLIGTFPKGFEVKVTGQCKETNWYRIEVTGGGIVYVSNNYLSDTKPVEETTSTPSTPSTSDTSSSSGGDNTSDSGTQYPGHKYIEVNGFTLDVTDKDDESIAFARKMAEAGYYNPVYHNGKYHMLIKGTDNHQEWVSWLYDYIKERGGIPNGGGGNNFCDTGDAYKIFVDVVE